MCYVSFWCKTIHCRPRQSRQFRLLKLSFKFLHTILNFEVFVWRKRQFFVIVIVVFNVSVSRYLLIYIVLVGPKERVRPSRFQTEAVDIMCSKRRISRTSENGKRKRESGQNQGKSPAILITIEKWRIDG